MFSSCNLHTGLDTLWGSAPTTNTASSAICLPFSTQKKALCVRAGLQPSTAVLPDAAHTGSDFMTDYCHPNHKAALPWQPQPKFLTWRIHEALQPSTRPCKQSYPQLFKRKVIIDPHSERQWVQEATAYRAQAAHPMAAAEDAAELGGEEEEAGGRAAQLALHMVPLLQGTGVSIQLI